VRLPASRGEQLRRPRKDVLLVATFLDTLPQGLDRARVFEEVSTAVAQRLQGFEAFARLRRPAGRDGRVFFAVGSAANAPDDLGSLRRALCKAVVRSGPLQRSRPAMWLRALDEMRALPVGQGKPKAKRQAISVEQARRVADRVSRAALRAVESVSWVEDE
jgi:hypothetical protein